MGDLDGPAGSVGMSDSAASHDLPGSKDAADSADPSGSGRFTRPPRPVRRPCFTASYTVTVGPPPVRLVFTSVSDSGDRAYQTPQPGLPARVRTVPVILWSSTLTSTRAGSADSPRYRPDRKYELFTGSSRTDTPDVPPPPLTSAPPPRPPFTLFQ